jgi:Bacteriophage HK97-gp10, putative tail-component
MATVQGLRALERRLAAIGHPKPVLKALQIATVSEAQKRVPRKTGHLQRNIVPGALTDDHAIVEARTPYARYVEEGTGIHGPRKKRIQPGVVMAWKANGRLTGRARARGSSTIFATSTQGAKAQPYLVPGAKAAVEASGSKDVIIKLWNGAA